MYEEKRKAINWKSLIIKILILALIVFLVIWVIQVINNRKNNNSNNKIFNQNIENMNDAAESYYKSNELPKNIGDKNKITLQDMIDNNLLMEFTDKNGNFCDEKNSYAQITKTKENLYQLKVLLSCDDNTDYLVKDFNIENSSSETKDTTETKDNIENNKQEKNQEESKSVEEINEETNNVDYIDEKVQEQTYTTYEKKKVYTYTTQYEFRKLLEESTTKYTCPDGYSLMGNKCFKSIIESEINATLEYYEDKDIITDPLEKIEDSKKEYTDPIKNTTEPTYSCPSGYEKTGSGINTKCYKISTTSKVSTSATKTCPSGYTLSGSSCIKYDNALSTPASANCPSGYAKINNSCIKYNKADVINATAKCSSGYTLSGSSCVKYDKAATINATAKCPSGYKLSGSSCIKYDTATKISAKISSYSCSKGSLSGSKCYSCPSGYTQSGKGANISCYINVPKYNTSYGNWYVYTTRKSTTALYTYSNNTEKMVYTGSKLEKTCSKCYTRRTYYYYTIYRRNVYTNTTYTKSYGKVTVTNATPNYKCSKGSRDGSSCYYCKSGTATGSGKNTKCKITNKNLTYSCSKGSKDGTSCYYCKSGTATGSGKKTQCKVTTNLTYSCSKGSKDGTSCYYCKFGTATGSGKNTKCKVSTGVQYSCKNGTLYQNKCYSCPTNYKQSSSTFNSSCLKTTYVNSIKNNGTTILSCPSGYTQEGSGNNIKCYKNITGKTSYYCEDPLSKLGADNKCHKNVKGEVKGYVCPEGYALKDQKCYKTTNEEVDAKEETTEAKYDYTWNNNETLEGWEFTGNTRTITNESEVTIESPKTGLFDSDNISKNIILIGFLTMGLGFISYLIIRLFKNKEKNIIQ